MQIRSGRVTSPIAHAALLLSFALPPSALAQTYTVEDLGTLGGDLSTALDIDARGLVVGASRVAGSTNLHGFVFDGTMIDVGTFGGPQSVARAINRYDEVVGWSFPATGERLAFLSKGGDMIPLGTFGGYSDARDINDSREVVGSSIRVPGNNERAFVWRGGDLVDLGTLGGTEARAFAINEKGEIVGFAMNGGGDLRPVLWRDGQVVDLGSLGGWAGHAYDLNENSKVVGWSMKVPNHISHAYIWSEGSLIDLGTLGGVYSSAFGINEAGLVVGTSTGVDGLQRAFMWDGIKMVDLNSRIPAGSGWHLITAAAINDDGRIVGVGVLDGEQHAFRLTPDHLLDVSLPTEGGEVEFYGATPNPVHHSTNLRFRLPAAGPVLVDVYDVEGRRVRRLADRSFPAGISSVAWDARDEVGAPVTAGAYWVLLRTPDERLTRRVSVLR